MTEPFARVVVGMPMFDGMLHHSILSAWDAIHRKHRSLFIPITGTYVDYARNDIVIKGRQVFLEQYGEEPEYYLFIDQDTVVPEVHADVFDKLRAHGKDIVSAFYVTKSFPAKMVFGWRSVRLHRRGRLWNMPTVIERQKVGVWKPGELIEVDAVGMGMALIRAEVFEKIPQPWFRTVSTKEFRVGEDVYFCEKAQKHGFKVWVDTATYMGHYGMTMYPWAYLGKTEEK